MQRTEGRLIARARAYKGGGGGGKVTPIPLQPRKGDAAQTLTQSKERNPQKRFRGFGQSILSGQSTAFNSILGG